MRRVGAWGLVLFVFAALLSALANNAVAQIVRPPATPRGTTAAARVTATARYPEGITLDTIPGLVARWAADTLVLNNNDPVENWPEATNGGVKTFTQPTAGHRPTYKTAIFASGKPAVSCDNDAANPDILRIEASPSVASAGALYAVLIPRDSTATNIWFGAGVDGTNNLRAVVNHDTGDGQWKQAARSVIGNLSAIGHTTNAGALAVDTAAIIRVGSSGTAWSIRVNASELAMSGTGSRGGNNGEWFDDQVFTAYSLCGLAYPTNNFSLQADVDIGEFIIVDGSQWTADDDAVFDLLNAKYSVY